MPWTRELTDTLAAWLAIDSTSGREGAYLEVLAEAMEARGLTVLRLPVEGVDEGARWNLLATGAAQPEVLLCTHVDTVPPFLPVRVEDGKVWGRGACDTKGVMLAMIEALAALRREDPALAERVGVLAVIGEETDHCGAAAAADLALRPRRIILGEPTRAMVAVGQKGILKARVRARGKAGHSAFPDQGFSAIDRLLDALEAVRRASWPDHPELGPTTVNIGTISGGVAANVFAPEAHADLMFRVVTSSAEVQAQLEALVGHGAEVEILSRAEPQTFDPPEGFETCVVPFNSDAAWLRALGPVWLVGPGDITLAHADHEHISVEALEQGVALYVRLLRAALS